MSGGNWFDHLHERLQYDAGGDGRLDLSSVLPPDELENGLIGGRAHVIEAGAATRRPGRVNTFGPGKLPDESSLAAIEAGRIAPLNIPSGKQGEVEGVNGFVFAIEMAQWGERGAGGTRAAGAPSSDRSPERLAIKGLLPFAQGNSWYEERLIG